MSIKSDAGLEFCACPLGCSPADSPVLSGRDLLHDMPGQFQVVQCRQCGLMRTHPRPSPAQIGAFYPDSYAPYLSTRIAQDAAELAAPSLRRRLGAWLRRLCDSRADAIPPMPPGQMLEVGCASGAFMHRMASKGWRVRGIEYSAVAADAARSRGYEVHCGPLETAPAPAQALDLIVGWMVLEHLHDPVAGLQKLRQWARPGACLALSVPNAAALEFRLFGARWYALQLPTHLFHYTPQTLEKVLAAGGWRMERLSHQRVLSNLIASLGYVARDWGLRRLGAYLIGFPDRGGRVGYALFPLAYLMALMGQTGRMTVWARAD